MADMQVIRLADTEVVKFGPEASYQLILGDDEGTTPIRTGIQTSQPGTSRPCTRIRTSKCSMCSRAWPRPG